MSVELFHLNYRSLPKDRQGVSEVFEFEGKWYGWQSGRHTGSLLQLSQREFGTAQQHGWKLVVDHDKAPMVAALPASHEHAMQLRIADGKEPLPPSVLLDCRECLALMRAYDPPFERDLCARCAVKAGKPKPCNHHWTNMQDHMCLWCKMPKPEGVPVPVPIRPTQEHGTTP